MSLFMLRVSADGAQACWYDWHEPTVLVRPLFECSGLLLTQLKKGGSRGTLTTRVLIGLARPHCNTLI